MSICPFKHQWLFIAVVALQLVVEGITKNKFPAKTNCLITLNSNSHRFTHTHTICMLLSLRWLKNTKIFSVSSSRLRAPSRRTNASGWAFPPALNFQCLSIFSDKYKQAILIYEWFFCSHVLISSKYLSIHCMLSSIVSMACWMQRSCALFSSKELKNSFTCASCGLVEYWFVTPVTMPAMDDEPSSNFSMSFSQFSFKKVQARW